MERDSCLRPDGWVPSNTHPSNTRILASNVDTLHLSFFGELDPHLAADLQSRRAVIEQVLNSSGKSAAENLPEGAVTIDGALFDLRLSRANGFLYRLANAEVALMVRPKSDGPMCCVRAQLGSALLWSGPWRSAVDRVERLVRSMLRAGIFTRPHGVARLDACADFQGWQPAGSDLDRFVARARHKTLRHVGRPFTGFEFGSGDLRARIYDKSAELESSGKLWMNDIWDATGRNLETPVWRLEFQARRESLVERGLGSLPEAPERLGSLWRYLMGDWLRLTVPQAGTRRERWPTDPAWESLSEAKFGDNGGELVRRRSREFDRERNLRGLLGNLKSLAAIDNHSTVPEVMRAVEAAVSARLAESGQRFEELVATRRRRFADLRPAA